MFVVGTAGHIDHGKSSLVIALTGIDPDRLPEEKLRGMTIDLGFAWLDLPSGRSIGIVDVPGHEKFIKNMIAGVGGIDAIILVVAADDGWMPQTEEHFQIAKLLGIKVGLVALTKKDLVPEDFVKLQIEEIRKHLQGSFLSNCDIIPISNTSGDGIQDLVLHLDRILDNSLLKQDIEAARLFIDRKFTIQGMGTIVTGTLTEGIVNADDVLELQPAGSKVRIRNIQTHKQTVKRAFPGNRVALNLAGIEKHQINRGDAVCSQGTILPSDKPGVEIELIAESPYSLKQGQEVSFLLGTANVDGRLHLLEGDILKSGEKRYGGMILKNPIPAKIGDRFIIRLISPPITVGGGRVLGLDFHAGNRNRKYELNFLKERAILNPSTYINSEITRNQFLQIEKLYLNSPFTKADIDKAIEKSLNAGLMIRSDDKIYLRSFLENFAEPAKRMIIDEIKSRPWMTGLEPGFLSKKLGISTNNMTMVINFLTGQNEVKFERGLISMSYHIAELKPEQKSLQGKLIARLSASPLSAPLKKEFIDENPMYEVVIDFLNDRSEIIELKGGVLFIKSDFDRILAQVVEYIGIKGKATASEIKENLKTSRKYAIPILEKLDQMGLTVRDGDYRKLA